MLREDSTQASLEDMLKADLANKGRMNIYRIVIQGTRAPELLLHYPGSESGVYEYVLMQYNQILTQQLI